MSETPTSVVTAAPAKIAAAASQALASGQKAVASGTPATKPPAKQRTKKKPTYVAEARKAITRLPDAMQLTTVTGWTIGSDGVSQPTIQSAQVSIKSLKKAVRCCDWRDYPKKVRPHRLVRDFLKKGLFTAWTRAQTEIYISRAAAGADQKLFDAVMAHEILHCAQFRKNGGRPPTTIEEMCEFEFATYGDTAKYLGSNHPHFSIMQDTSDKFAAALDVARIPVNNKTPTKDARNAELRAWMINTEYLPNYQGPVSNFY